MEAQSNHVRLQRSACSPPITSPLALLRSQRPNARCTRTILCPSRGKAHEFLLCKSISRAPRGLVWKPRKSGFNTCFARLEGKSIQRGHTQPEFEGSRSFFGMIIEKALQAYLRSQLEKCGELKISVAGKNQELISGQVEGIRVFAKGAVYKGLVLTAVDLQSSPLKFQLGNNQPLLHPFNVNASIRIREDDLNFSLSSPLLFSALSDVLPHWDLSRGLPKLSVAVRDGYLQVERRQPEHSVDLSLELKDEGKSLHVSSVEGGSDLVPIQRQFGMTGVQISKLDIDTDLLSVIGDFTVTP